MIQAIYRNILTVALFANGCSLSRSLPSPFHPNTYETDQQLAWVAIFIIIKLIIFPLGLAM